MRKCVVKSSNIYYINTNQPERLYQVAEDYYQRALAFEQECLYTKARVSYQKAEDYYQKARDGFKARKQADKAKKQADDARKLADDAKKQADGFREQVDEIYSPVQRIIRKYDPPSAVALPQPRQAKPAQPPRIRREEPIQKAVSQRVENVEVAAHELPTAVNDVPNPAGNNENRPISWRGKRHG
ncbi:MAG: hypothetical protein FWG31_05880 [Oscillospiraceae bacterium]|nr:hypothetical protein [Oscillospiraceae bacterium]